MASSRAAPDPELTGKLTTLVQRLTTELGIGGGRSAEGLATASVAMLSKMISPYDVTKVATQQAQKVLNEHAPDADAFAGKYRELKAWTGAHVHSHTTTVIPPPPSSPPPPP